MTSRERMLYQQIHPLKLLTDFGTSFASTGLLWQGQWQYALVAAFLPSIAVTVWLMRFADLRRYRDTALGAYVARHMTTRIVAERIAGQLLVWAGAVTHVAWLLPFGYFVIVLAWLNGLWAPAPSPSSESTATAGSHGSMG